MQRNGVKSEFGKNLDLENRITNLQRQLEQKNFDIKKLKTELDDKDEDVRMLTQTFEHEYELLRKENERNVLELQKTFKENIEKSRPSTNMKNLHISEDENNSLHEQSSQKSDFHTPISSATARLDMKPPIAPVMHHKY